MILERVEMILSRAEVIPETGLDDPGNMLGQTAHAPS